MQIYKNIKDYALALILYPFVWGAVAINLFMLSLGWQAVGLEVLSPLNAMLIALPLAIPANILCLKWIRSLLDQAQ